jgi:hypothetical protein
MVAIGGTMPTGNVQGSAERNIFAFDLRRGSMATKLNHQLRMQLRSVACFMSADGIASFSHISTYLTLLSLDNNNGDDLVNRLCRWFH